MAFLWKILLILGSLLAVTVSLTRRRRCTKSKLGKQKQRGEHGGGNALPSLSLQQSHVAATQ